MTMNNTWVVITMRWRAPNWSQQKYLAPSITRRSLSQRNRYTPDAERQTCVALSGRRLEAPVGPQPVSDASQIGDCDHDVELGGHLDFSFDSWSVCCEWITMLNDESIGLPERSNMMMLSVFVFQPVCCEWMPPPASLELLWSAHGATAKKEFGSTISAKD